MTPAAAVLWDLLTGAGGSLALSLIVTLALGLAALALLFLGSAVVTLARFARVVRRPLTGVAFGSFWSLLCGVGSVGFSGPVGSAKQYEPATRPRDVNRVQPLEVLNLQPGNPQRSVICHFISPFVV